MAGPPDHGCRSTGEVVRAPATDRPAVRAIRAAGEDRVRDAVLGAIDPFRTTSGGCRRENVFRFLAATA